MIVFITKQFAYFIFIVLEKQQAGGMLGNDGNIIEESETEEPTRNLRTCTQKNPQLVSLFKLMVLFFFILAALIATTKGMWLLLLICFHAFFKFLDKNLTIKSMW
jgi:hypothetical protein